jgi:hypothetical protein
VHGTPAQPPISTASKSLCLSFDPQCNSPSIAVKYRDVPTPPVRLDSGAINGKVGPLRQASFGTVFWKPGKPLTGTGSGQAHPSPPPCITQHQQAVQPSVEGQLHCSFTSPSRSERGYPSSRPITCSQKQIARLQLACSRSSAQSATAYLSLKWPSSLAY